MRASRSRHCECCESAQELISGLRRGESSRESRSEWERGAVTVARGMSGRPNGGTSKPAAWRPGGAKRMRSQSSCFGDMRSGHIR